MTPAFAQPASGQSPDPGASDLCGQAVSIDVSGVLWWADERVLVVADLHLEKGVSLASRGALIPPYDTAATLARLAQVIARFAPARVIALGDSFHDDKVSAGLPRDLREQIAAMMSGRDWVWVAGNHDPAPPANIGGDFAAELGFGPLLFRHEPHAGSAHGEIAGHLHPAASVTVRGRRLRRRCAASDGTRMILPAFGAYTGGLNVRDPAFAGLFDPGALSVFMLGREAVYKVSGKRAGYGR